MINDGDCDNYQHALAVQSLAVAIKKQWYGHCVAQLCKVPNCIVRKKPRDDVTTWQAVTTSIKMRLLTISIDNRTQDGIIHEMWFNNLHTGKSPSTAIIIHVFWSKGSIDRVVEQPPVWCGPGFDPCWRRTWSVFVDVGPKLSVWLTNQRYNPTSPRASPRAAISPAQPTAWD